MHPFTGLATREDGAVQICCRSHPISNIQDETLEDAWNNEKIKRIRRQVLNNERPPECEPCFSLEDQGVESLRQRHIKGIIPEARINLYPNAIDKLSDDYTMPFEIPTMELKLNNLCNLKCRMCHPGDSTSWNDWSEIKEFYQGTGKVIYNLVEDHDLEKKPLLDKFENNTDWWKSLEKNLPNFRRVEFAGGEPLMDPQHYKILDMLAPYGNQIEIKYATNGTTLGIKGGRTIHDYWPKFKSVAVNVSIDGYRESYEYIRGNAKWDDVIQNIKEMQKISNISRIVGAVAVQVSNVLILDKMIEYFLDDLGIVFYTNMVKYPDVLSIQVLPSYLKGLAIQRLEFVRDRIETFKFVQKNPILSDITRGQINGVINFIRADDLSDHWPECVRYNQLLDQSRKQSFTKTTPEFEKYV
jgi:molybdenum cofactor biosynthesis enzyme MoaA